MTGEAVLDLLELTDRCGCGAKMPAARLRDLLGGVLGPPSPDLLVGPDTFDDAAVYRLRDDCLAVLTADFFPPVASDPFLYGRIAAANALSDVYAMGGRPVAALALLCFPSRRLPLEVGRRILAGAADALAEAGACLAGGHTLDDPDLRFGLAVTGLVEPGQVLTNAGARPGDVLVLTKPIGTGVMITAAKARLAPEVGVAQANRVMAALNRRAASAAIQAGARAATDVTGFSLLGHAWQMAKASGVRFRLRAGGVPTLEGAADVASMGLVPAGAYANREYLAGRAAVAADVPRALQDLLFDPQTSGGLLVSVPPAGVETFRRAFGEAADGAAAVVGRVEAGDEEPRLIVEKGGPDAWRQS